MRAREESGLSQTSAAAVTHRWTIVVAVVGTAVLVGPPDALDGLMVAKTTLVYVAAIVALAIAAGAGTRAARLVVVREPAIVAGVVFVGVLVVMTMLSSNPAQSFAGALPRWTGTSMYLACAVLFLVTASRFTATSVGLALRALAVTAAVLAALSMGEALDLISFGGSSVSGARTTFGNPNFLAGWLAMTVPLGAALALDDTATLNWRRVGGGAAAAAFVGAALTLSLQGLVAASVGLALLGLVWMGERLRAGQVRAAATAVVAVGTAVLVAGLLGAQGSGPLSALEDQAGIEHRGYYWQAAVSMVAEEPLTGTGPGRFGDHYRLHRPLEDALASPLEDVADAAHSVPLELAAGGGIPVFLAYVGWVALVAWRLWRGLATLEGRDRTLLGGVGAAWLAYMVQSLVSIDVAPLAVMGWVLGGLVVALAARGRVWQVQLPWKAARQGRPRRSTGITPWAVDGATVLVAAGLLWLALLPLRVDAGAVEAAVTPAGELDQESGLVQAARLAGWEPAYGMQVVRAHIALGDLEAAASASADLVERSPDSLEVVLSAARLAAEVDDAEVATQMYERALVLEPMHPALALEFAAFAEGQGDIRRAHALVNRVLALEPAHPDATLLAEDLRAR